jgi:N-acetylglutamate synthase-like GNAT family acetyltransferase
MIQKAITMTSKGTFTLPVSVHKQLGVINAGDKLLLTFHEQSKKIEISGIPNLQAIQQENAAFLAQQGFTPKKLKQMAENYQNGDGLAAHVQKKYGHQ